MLTGIGGARHWALMIIIDDREVPAVLSDHPGFTLQLRKELGALRAAGTGPKRAAWMIRVMLAEAAAALGDEE